jgi:hypothetical protein
MSARKSPRIIPLNLPAGVEKEIAGNPVTTRIETAPANCFPGLDVDIRNLDRRFFPGLVFNFHNIDDGDPRVLLRGPMLAEVDLNDPDVKAELKTKLTTLAPMLPDSSIFLQSVTPSTGKKIEFVDKNGIPFDWDVSWRLVRSLEPGELTIELSCVEGKERILLMELKARRRTYQNVTGELSDAYNPGELTQSLCSPWQHDFRDCSCTYWASNHPDIVMAAHPMDIAEFDDEGRDQDRAEEPLVWLRWDRSQRVSPQATGDATRPLEMDHYEINQRWRELSIVLEGREQLTPWNSLLQTVPESLEAPSQEADPIDEVSSLAGMEQALALEYLYARYTVRFYDELPLAMQAHAEFIAHEVLNVAIGEMMHLRWANELLAELQKMVGRKVEPELKVGAKVPSARFIRDHELDRQPEYEMTDRPTQERPIDEAIDDFIAAELPSGTLHGKYAHILSVLKRGWPRAGDVRQDLVELVERIAADGVEHYARFREIRALLLEPGGRDLVKHLKKVEPGSREYKHALGLYRDVVDSLLRAYGPKGNRKEPAVARRAMKDLDEFARRMAKAGRAIPLISIANEVAKHKR